jgi:hypothetical protein
MHLSYGRLLGAVYRRRPTGPTVLRNNAASLEDLVFSPPIRFAIASAIAETVPGYEASVWYGLAAPKGTPAEIIE